MYGTWKKLKKNLVKEDKLGLQKKGRIRDTRHLMSTVWNKKGDDEICIPIKFNMDSFAL